jgi:hypothetical protein
MRFMMLVKASKDSEAGAMPDDRLIAAMTKYNEEMAKTGILLDLAGLQPSLLGQALPPSARRRSRRRDRASPVVRARGLRSEPGDRRRTKARERTGEEE